jgi:hypothetical protein
MKNYLVALICFSMILFSLLISYCSLAQEQLDSILPVRGICLSSPKPESVDKFIKFIKDELIPLKVNTLVILIDYGYKFKSHPELIGENPLSEQDVKKIVKVCREGGIRIIPQINLLGHQSWFQKVGQLLKAYPQFNETPHVPTSGGSTELKWPNEWGLYCLSYCPLHPNVHNVVFDVVDEIVNVFEAKAFHAGMDEVFYLGDDKCPRCQGRDKAELFAGEVTKVRNHLAQKNIELWIWGDRLLDGKTTGIGLWEASYNNTHRAIDMIPKDVVINDWHYERPDPTAIYFALKGFKVVTCPWRFPDVTKTQLQIMVDAKKYATPEVKDNYQGILHTTWTSAEDFIDQYYGKKEVNTGRGGNYVEAFKALFSEINKLDVNPDTPIRKN